VTGRRIAVNTAIHQRGTSGSSSATSALVEALRYLPDVDVREVAPRRRRGRFSVLNAVADARWDLWLAGRTLSDVDLLVSSCNIGLRGRAAKHVLVVYDVMVFDHPDLFDRRFAAYFRLLVPRSARRADRILTMSEHAARRLRGLAPGADVRVLSWPHPTGKRTPVSFSTPHTVLMVGATEPVKNQVAGVRAVAGLRSDTGADLLLRVIGPAGRAEQAVREALAAADPARRWTSREVDVSSEELDAAYASSWLLLQPSYDEGFGLPLVEAARHGLPVVHSGRGPMSEIAPEGDAGGIRPRDLVSAMNPLLDRSAWEEAAAAARARADAYRPESFREAVRYAVSDLLPGAQ
jgi:glycosyltransferase involved in cell wall biosynthesis